MSLALINQEKVQIQESLIKAMHDKDENKFKEALGQLFEINQKEVLEKAEELAGVTDTQILASRGVHKLTSKEKKYYEKVIEAMKSDDPKQALTNIEVAMPETVIDSVFDELEKEHPLLQAIDFENTRGAIKFLMSKNDYQKAVWGKLTDTITKEIESSFEEVDISLMKLSAYIPVNEAMLDLGPEWLDLYTRKCLYEALANGLEDGMINNLNTTTGPVGMIADMATGSGGVGKATFTAKSAVPIVDLSPTTIGTQLAAIAEDEEGNARPVTNVILVVNPIDYLTKVFPATTVMTGNGTYQRDVLPFPMTIIQSAAVARGKAVLGLAKKYFMGIGMSSKAGKLEYSDEFKWLEDIRTYKIKLYANGMPKDNKAFLYLDISGLKPLTVMVTVTNDPLSVQVDGTVTTKTEGAA